MDKIDDKSVILNYDKYQGMVEELKGLKEEREKGKFILCVDVNNYHSYYGEDYEDYGRHGRSNIIQSMDIRHRNWNDEDHLSAFKKFLDNYKDEIKEMVSKDAHKDIEEREEVLQEKEEILKEKVKKYNKKTKDFKDRWWFKLFGGKFK